MERDIAFLGNHVVNGGACYDEVLNPSVVELYDSVGGEHLLDSARILLVVRRVGYTLYSGRRTFVQHVAEILRQVQQTVRLLLIREISGVDCGSSSMCLTEIAWLHLVVRRRLIGLVAQLTA